MFKKSILLLLCLALLMSMLSACASKQTASTDRNKLPVSVSFNAMAELVTAIGKDKVSVSTIIPDGTEPHDFEPKAADLASLSSAKLFVYNGFGMESWVPDALTAVNNKNLIVVQACDDISPISNTDPDEIKEHGSFDPHIWLSLKNAETISQHIKTALIQADPENQSYYESNYNSFVTSLETLYNEYNTKFHTVNNKSFVTGHAAFAYLCRDFGLTQNSVEDVYAEGEPSAQQLASLVTYCKTNNVKTVFAEELASPEVSNTLAKEVGATVETIYTVESSEDNMTYLDRMESNLDKIYKSLQ